jgi:hypothetical protein
MPEDALQSFLNGVRGSGGAQGTAQQATLAQIKQQTDYLLKSLPKKINQKTGKPWTNVEILQYVSTVREKMMQDAGLWPKE